MARKTYNKFNTGTLKNLLLARNDSPIYNASVRYSDNFSINNTGQVSFRHGFKLIAPTFKNKKAWYLSFKNTLFELTDKHIRTILLDKLDSTFGEQELPFGSSFLANISTTEILPNGDIKISFSMPIKGSIDDLKAGDELMIRYRGYPGFSNISDQTPNVSLSYTINNYTIVSIDTANNQIIISNPNKIIFESPAIAAKPSELTDPDFTYTEDELPFISTVKIDDGILIAHPNHPLKYLKYDVTNQTFSISNYLSDATIKTLPAKITAILLYEGRLYCVGDNWLFASKVNDFTNFTFGTADDSAFKFRITNTNSREEQHQFYWLTATNKALYLGSKYGIVQISGGSSLEDPITPTKINIKPVGNINSANIKPIHYIDYVIYAISSEDSLRLVDYSPFGEGSRNITISEYTDLFIEKNITSLELLRTADDKYILVLTNNGEIIYGLVQFSENGTYGAWMLWSMDYSNFTSIYVTTIDKNNIQEDELFACININGLHYTESLTKPALLPNLFNYQNSIPKFNSTPAQRQEAYKKDLRVFELDLLKANTLNNFLDSSFIYDAFEITAKTFIKNRILTIKENNILNSNISLFRENWVTGQIAFKQDNDLNIIIQIIEFIDTLNVKYTVISVNKPKVGDTFTGGQWGKGINEIKGLPITRVPISIVPDNGKYYEQKVTVDSVFYAGDITLPTDFIFRAYVGIKYTGKLVTIPFSSLDNKKSISQVKIQLLNSSDFSIGRNFYYLTDVKFTDQFKISGKQVIPFTGNKVITLPNSESNKEGIVCIYHDTPYSLNILHITVDFSEANL